MALLFENARDVKLIFVMIWQKEVKRTGTIVYSLTLEVIGIF